MPRQDWIKCHARAGAMLGQKDIHVGTLVHGVKSRLTVILGEIAFIAM